MPAEYLKDVILTELKVGLQDHELQKLCKNTCRVGQYSYCISNVDADPEPVIKQ